MAISGDQLRISYKNPVRVATTSNIANILSGAPNIVDGVVLINNDRILIKSQTNGSENGIYTVTTAGTGSNGVWARSKDWDSSSQDNICAGTTVPVQEGALGKNTKYTLTTVGTIIVGATPIIIEPEKTVKNWQVNSASIIANGDKVIFGKLSSSSIGVLRTFDIHVMAIEAGIQIKKEFNVIMSTTNSILNWRQLTPSYDGFLVGLPYNFAIDIITGASPEELQFRVRKTTGTGVSAGFSISIDSHAPGDETFTELNTPLTGIDTILSPTGRTTSITPLGILESDKVAFSGFGGNVTGNPFPYITYAASTFQIKSPSSITSYLNDLEKLKLSEAAGVTTLSLSAPAGCEIGFNSNATLNVTGSMTTSISAGTANLVSIGGTTHTTQTIVGADSFTTLNGSGSNFIQTPGVLALKGDTEVQIAGNLAALSSITLRTGDINMSIATGRTMTIGGGEVNIADNINVTAGKQLNFGVSGHLNDAIGGGMVAFGDVLYLQSTIAAVTVGSGGGNIDLLPEAASTVNLQGNVVLSSGKTINLGVTGYINDSAGAGTLIYGDDLQLKTISATIRLTSTGDIRLTPSVTGGVLFDNNASFAQGKQVNFGVTGNINDFIGSGISVYGDALNLQSLNSQITLTNIGDINLTPAFGQSSFLNGNTIIPANGALKISSFGLIDDFGGVGLRILADPLYIENTPGTGAIRLDASGKTTIISAGTTWSFNGGVLSSGTAQIDMGSGNIGLKSLSSLLITFSGSSGAPSMTLDTSNHSLIVGIITGTIPYQLAASGTLGLYHSSTGGSGLGFHENGAISPVSYINGSSTQGLDQTLSQYGTSTASSGGLFLPGTVVSHPGEIVVKSRTAIRLKALGDYVLGTTYSTGADVFIENSSVIWSVFKGKKEQLVIGVAALDLVNTIAGEASYNLHSLLVSNKIESLSSIYATGIFTKSSGAASGSFAPESGTTSILYHPVTLALISGSNYSSTASQTTGQVLIKADSIPISANTSNQTIGSLNFISNSVNFLMGSGPIAVYRDIGTSILSNTAQSSYVQDIQNSNTTSPYTNVLRLSQQNTATSANDTFLMCVNSAATVPVIKYRIKGTGATATAFTGNHWSLFKSSAGKTFLSETRQGLIVVSAGEIWNSKTDIENAWPVTTSSSTRNDNKVFGVLSDISSEPSNLKYWTYADRPINYESISAIFTTIQYIFDGTNVVTSSNTSDVSAGDYIALKNDGNFFKVESVQIDTSITLASFSSGIPIGTGVLAISKSPIVAPLPYSDTSSYFKAKLNSVGEGRILVSDFDGQINNGDLISLSAVIDENGMVGYGGLQADDLFHSYTVAKATEQVDWTLITDTFVHNGVTYKRALIGCTYHCG